MTSLDECMQARIKCACLFYLTRWLWRILLIVDRAIVIYKAAWISFVYQVAFTITCCVCFKNVIGFRCIVSSLYYINISIWFNATVSVFRCYVFLRERRKFVWEAKRTSRGGARSHRCLKAGKVASQQTRNEYGPQDGWTRGVQVALEKGYGKLTCVMPIIRCGCLLKPASV